MRLPWHEPAEQHARLAARARAGDAAAFVALYRELYPPVARFVARRVPARADAEDLVARTFHRFLEGLAAFDPARGSPLALALAMARSQVADHRRARAPHAPEAAALEAADEAPDPEARLARAETLRAVADLLQGLPPATRELLELRFGDGLTHAEIAALTGGTVVAIRQRLSRALRALREAARAAPGAKEVSP
jgi:RNA polymerase sigma-70 factor (ECF subfamily)